MGLLSSIFGSSSSSSSTAGPVTTNNDNRMALSDAIGIGAGASVGGDINRITYAADAEVLKTLAETLPDAVNFMVNAGANVINQAGGAVVDLNRDSMAQNTRAFDSVVNFGSRAIDRIIDASVKTSAAGNQLAAQTVASYQPDSKNQADTAKYALYAAGAVVALVLLNGKKA